MFKTHEFLLNWNVAGNAIWLTHFTPVRVEHLRIVKRLLETFCALDICCAITGTYFAYIACALSSYYSQRPAVGELHIARTNSSILDKIYRKNYTFEFGPFEFGLTAWLE